MNSIKSATKGMYLCMFRRHYIDGYNLCMSHHGTIHSRHTLQVTLLASIFVNTTEKNNQTCGVLKTWLARKNLHKLRTRHAN